MCRIPFAGLLVLALASHASADTYPFKATVIDAEVKLRAGESDQFPETGTLRKGSVVIVEKDAGNGWLAVTAYGSVSWVATQFIDDPNPEKAAPKNVFVHGETEVTLSAGKVGLDQPLDVRRVKIPEGSTLVLLGPKATYNNRTWYMVQSPPGDFRYLPKTAVQFDKPAANNFTVRVNESVTPLPPGGSLGSSPVLSATPAGGPVATVPGPSITTATGGSTSAKPAVNHPLWAQAEVAERENRLADAEKLYFQLAEEMNRPNGDHDVANLCYTRIHTIREKQRVARGTTTAPAPGPSVLRPPVKEDRGVRPGTPEPLPPAAKEDRQETQVGLLRRSALTPDGPNRQLYILESPQGEVKLYVTGGPGVDLGKYLGRRVEVSGTTTTRTGLSKTYMVATAVESAP